MRRRTSPANLTLTRADTNTIELKDGSLLGMEVHKLLGNILFVLLDVR